MVTTNINKYSKIECPKDVRVSVIHQLCASINSTKEATQVKRKLQQHKDAFDLEQSSNLGHFMSIVSRALVVYKLKQCAEENVWLDFAKDCGIEYPSHWSSLGALFVIMFPGCMEESGPNKQDFESGCALTNSPVRFLGWSSDIWFRFAGAGKYLFTLFPAINRFMTDHVNQSPTSSSPVSVHLSVSDHPIEVESIAQTSSDEDRTSSDDDIPSSQTSGKRQRKH